jgi:hypothetical protein
MDMRNSCICVALVVSLSSIAAGQSLALTGRLNSNPIYLGATVLFTLESTSPVVLTSACGFNEIRAGSPTGPIAFLSVVCPGVAPTVSPGSPYLRVWDQRNNAGFRVPAGEYYARFTYIDPNFANPVNRWIPVRLDDATAPPLLTLSAIGFPVTGTPYSMQIIDASNPGAPYVIAASFTTDTGWTVSPGVHIALDQDALWNLSYPIANASLFTGFTGVLDATGSTTAPSIAVPNLPSLVGLPLAIQAVVIGTGGAVLTNTISTVIR